MVTVDDLPLIEEIPPLPLIDLVLDRVMESRVNHLDPEPSRYNRPPSPFDECKSSVDLYIMTVALLMVDEVAIAPPLPLFALLELAVQ